MILLRRVGKQDSCRVILSDPLIGATDGVNQTFSVSYEYTPGRIEILYNGQVLTSPQDFTETGPDEITFVYQYPEEQTILRANYEIGDCTATGGSTLDFVDLQDTPSNYTSQAGKLVSVNNSETGLSFIDFEPGLTNFISLTDTPTTYSGFEDHYVKVTPSGDGLEFVLPEGDVQEGITSIASGAYSTAVMFDRKFDNDQYILTVGLENKADPEPSVYPVLIKDKTDSGFTVDFSGDIDSDNYYLNWRATLSGTGTVGGGGAGISELSNDLSPELGGNLEVGDHLVMLKTAPNGTTISGGYVRGHSGDASEMFVFDNSSAGDGFGTPLHMRSDGKWGTCTAVSGTAQRMPCGALALEPGDGGIKKILWKGIIRKGEWGWTPGDLIYVSTVEGALVNIEPNNGHRKQCIGLAIASDTIRFDPGFNPGS